MFSVHCNEWKRYFLSLCAKKILRKSFSSTSALNSTHYEVLGIPQNSTQNDIKSAYYKLSMQYHPDKNAGCEKAAKKFREIKQAYEVLGNYELRRLYDKGAMHYAYNNQNQSTSPIRNVVEDEDVNDDPATKFYKSRFRRTKVADVSGRTPIYNYDEWSRAHYGSSFQRRKDAKAKYERNTNRNAESKAHEALLFGVIFAGVIVYANFYDQSTYDTPKVLTYTEEKKTQSTQKD